MLKYKKCKKGNIMRKKREEYTVAFKTKLVLEVLKNERTLAEIASEYNVLVKNLTNWKATFLENAEIAMDPKKCVKEYQKQIDSLQEACDSNTKIIGKLTIEKEWLSGKLKSLDLISKRGVIDSKHAKLSISEQCEIISLSRSSYYFKTEENEIKTEVRETILRIFNETPIYGGLKVHQVLLEAGYEISPNTVFKYRREMNLRAILAVKEINLSIPNIEHVKHSYKLRGLKINKPNHVWSTDITYIKINGTHVYLSAIIDWYSKAILAYSISNTMDTELVTDVLNRAIRNYGKPRIVNTDQGSQYTSKAHTGILKEHKIKISMDGKGRATDNIAIERFWRSAKCEMIYLNQFEALQELRTAVDEYIQFYNFRRLHQTLKYKKPMDVYIANFPNQRLKKKIIKKLNYAA